MKVNVALPKKLYTTIIMKTDNGGFVQKKYSVKQSKSLPITGASA